VLAGAAVATRQLLRAPALRVLAISRAPLRVAGEIVYVLGPLPIHETEHGADAVALLRDRVGPSDDASDDALAAICRRLDGLPLAIELAAPLVRSLGAAVLTDRAAQLRPLMAAAGDAPSRHHSIDATIRWSLELLDRAEQAGLEAAAMFAGPFTAACAEQLFPAFGIDRSQVLARLVRLVDCSLLVVEAAARGATYRLLDTVRSYVRDAMGERLDPSLDAHAAWVRDVVRRAGKADARGRRPDLPVEDIADEVAAALDHLERRHEGSSDHLGLASGLGFFWNHTGRVAEGRARLHRALDSDHTDDTLVRCLALAGAGFLAWYQGDFGDVDRRLTEALELLAPLGVDELVDLLTAGRAFVRRDNAVAERHIVRTLAADPAPSRQRLVALDMGANIAWFRGDHALALERFRLQASVADAIDDRFALAQALRGGAVQQARLGDTEAGWAMSARSLRIANERADDLSIAQSHAACAAVAAAAGALSEARQHAVEAVRRSVRQFDTFALLLALPMLAEAEGARGRYPQVAMIDGWLRTMRETTGVFAPQHAVAACERAVEVARNALGRRDYARMLALGGRARLVELLDALA
jgi:predicted ATPase